MLKRIKAIVFSLIAVIMCIISLSSVQGLAWANLCSSTGSANMAKTRTPNVLTLQEAHNPLKSVTNRKYTGVELFEQSVNYSVVNGDRDDNDWLRANRTTVIDILQAESAPNQEAIDRVKQTGQSLACVTGGFMTGLQSTFLGITKFFAKMTASVVQIFFDNTLICDGSGKNCYIDLLKISAGEENGNGGIIGQLTRGVFMPLTVVAFICTAFWLLYTALWKGELRKGLGGLLWAIGSFIVGVIVMVAPIKIAKIPQTGVNIISTCIFNTLTGGSCLDSGPQIQEQKLDQFCTSYGNTTDPNDLNQMGISSLTCSIVKSIAIDRWSEQQFGRTFNELYTMNAPEGYTVIPKENLAGNPEDYCVNMYATTSAEDMIQQNVQQKTVTFTDGNGKAKVCNIAAAYLANATIGNFGETNALTQTYESKGSRIVTGQSYVMATLAKNEDMWNAMVGNGRDVIGLFAVLSSIIAAAIFLPIALSGLAFKFISMITIILAPVFILFSIHPGKGKKIFLGWLQGFLSAMMKYFAVGILLVVMVNIYGSVFANLNGTMLLVVSMVLALVFLSYRKDVVELLGKVDLGGTQLSNALGERLDKIANKAKDYGTATLAGGIAGQVTGQGFMHGAVEGLTMQASRGSGLIASGVRTARRLNNEAKATIDKANRATAEANRNAENRQFLNNMNQNTQMNANAYGDNENKQYVLNDLQTEAQRIENQGGDSTGTQNLVNNLRNEVEKMSPEEVREKTQDIQKRKEMLTSVDENVRKFGTFAGKRNFINQRVAEAETNINQHAKTIEDVNEREKFVKSKTEEVKKYKTYMQDSISITDKQVNNIDTKRMVDIEKNFTFTKPEKEESETKTTPEPEKEADK